MVTLGLQLLDGAGVGAGAAMALGALGVGAGVLGVGAGVLGVGAGVLGVGAGVRGVGAGVGGLVTFTLGSLNGEKKHDAFNFWNVCFFRKSFCCK